LVHLAVHVLLFERSPSQDFDASAGVRLLAIAIVVEALRLVAPGERAHAEGQGPLRCDRHFLICQDKLECFKHSSYYLPTKDRIWQAAAVVRLIAVACYIRPSIRSFRIMSARVSGTETAEWIGRDERHGRQSREGRGDHSWS